MFLSKKIFIASSSVLLVILLFWGIYNFSFRQPSTQNNPADNGSNMNTAQEKMSSTGKKERIQALSDEPVLSPALSPDNSFIRYYSKATGKVYQIDLASLNKQTVSNNNLPGLMDVFWSPDQTKVLSKFAGGSSYPKFSFYDYSIQSGGKLDENIGAVSWQNSNKIFYTYFDRKTKKKSINISDPDGKNWHKVIDFSPDSITISAIPRSSFVSFWNKPDSFTETALQSTPVLGGETKLLSSGVFGADYLWSNDGTMFLRSNVDQKGGHKMELGVANSLGGEYKNLGIPTFVSKCVWSKNGDSVFYALPGAISEKSILPNDYLNNLFTTTDTFWKVNLKTGEKTRLVPLEELATAYDATGLILSFDEKDLFFINKIDGKLYRIAL